MQVGFLTQTATTGMMLYALSALCPVYAQISRSLYRSSGPDGDVPHGHIDRIGGFEQTLL